MIVDCCTMAICGFEGWSLIQRGQMPGFVDLEDGRSRRIICSFREGIVRLGDLDRGLSWAAGKRKRWRNDPRLVNDL